MKNKIKFFGLLLFGLLFFCKPILAATTDFISDSNITVSGVTFGATTTDLLILSSSGAESWTYNSGLFTVTNPDAINIFKVGSEYSAVPAIRVSNSGGVVVACIKNSNPGTSYVSLPTGSDVYTVEPVNINLSNSISYNSSCGAASCSSGYVVSGNGVNAACVQQSSGGGGGGGGGLSLFTPTVTATGAVGNTIGLTIDANQNGSLVQALGNNYQVEVSVPQNSVVAKTTFTATKELLTDNLAPTLLIGAYLVGGQVFNINAINANNDTVHSFSNTLSITLTIPNLASSTNNLGVYFYDESSNEWALVTNATFNFISHQVTFSVNHLTNFAVFNVADLPQTLGTKMTNESTTTVSASYINTVLATEKKMSKKNDQTLTKRLAGRILLQTETLGRAWYLDSVSLKRYYLADGQSAYGALRQFGLGIKNVDIVKIPIGLESRFSMTDGDNDGLPDQLEQALGTNPNKADTDGDGFKDGLEIQSSFNPLGTGKLVYSAPLVSRLKGRILIQTESHGEAWYLNPVDGKRYYLASGEAAYQIMRYLSLGIKNDDIHKITVGN